MLGCSATAGPRRRRRCHGPKPTGLAGKAAVRCQRDGDLYMPGTYTLNTVTAPLDGRVDAVIVGAGFVALTAATAPSDWVQRPREAQATRTDGRDQHTVTRSSPKSRMLFASRPALTTRPGANFFATIRSSGCRSGARRP